MKHFKRQFLLVSLNLISILFLVQLHSCEENETLINFSDESETLEIAACVQAMIEIILSEEVWSSPAQVWEWKVDDKTYYYFTADCCDQFNQLFDDSCNYVCAPDGGFTGAGDGLCPDFGDEIVKQLLWEDTRD